MLRLCQGLSLGGGFKHFWYFHPEPWGNNDPIWRLRIFFRWAGEFNHQLGQHSSPSPEEGRWSGTIDFNWSKPTRPCRGSQSWRITWGSVAKPKRNRKLYVCDYFWGDSYCLFFGGWLSIFFPFHVFLSVLIYHSLPITMGQDDTCWVPEKSTDAGWTCWRTRWRSWISNLPRCHRGIQLGVEKNVACQNDPTHLCEIWSRGDRREDGMIQSWVDSMSNWRCSLRRLSRGNRVLCCFMLADLWNLTSAEIWWNVQYYTKYSNTKYNWIKTWVPASIYGDEVGSQSCRKGNIVVYVQNEKKIR